MTSRLHGVDQTRYPSPEDHRVPRLTDKVGPDACGPLKYSPVCPHPSPGLPSTTSGTGLTSYQPRRSPLLSVSVPCVRGLLPFRALWRSAAGVLWVGVLPQRNRSGVCGSCAHVGRGSGRRKVSSRGTTVSGGPVSSVVVVHRQDTLSEIPFPLHFSSKEWSFKTCSRKCNRRQRHLTNGLLRSK